MSKVLYEETTEFNKCTENVQKCDHQPIYDVIREELIKKLPNDLSKINDNSYYDNKCELCKIRFKTKSKDLLTVKYGSINPLFIINIVCHKDKSEDDHRTNRSFDDKGVENQAFQEEEKFGVNLISKEETDMRNIYDVNDKDNTFNNSLNKSSDSTRSSFSTNIKMSNKRQSVSQASQGSAKRRESLKNMIFGDPVKSGRRFSQDIRSRHKEIEEEDETLKVIFLQVFIPFLIAGFGNVGAGLILDHIQYWDVFQSVSELFILVASFLGFKGNLEMTLAARLSTQANLGNLDKLSEQWKIGVGNVLLIQCQAIVVALLAAIVAVAVNIAKEWKLETDNILLICATSLITASITGLLLATLMIIVIIISRKTGVNPDNCSTLIAAFLGDISAVIVLATTARLLYQIRHISWIAPILIASFLVVLPFLIYLTQQNEHTSQLVKTGWWPIVIAMFISSAGGFIFDFAVSIFKTIAIFQPIINGVGANLVAVQVSRISTFFHQRCDLGDDLQTKCGIKSSIFQSPHNAFIGSNTNVRTARLLLIMVVPGHLIYLITIYLINVNDIALSASFVLLYLSVALIQVSFLLYIAHVLVPFLWIKSVDPDNAAIPAIMATGDLIGTSLLTLAFLILLKLKDPNASYKNLIL